MSYRYTPNNSISDIYVSNTDSNLTSKAVLDAKVLYPEISESTKTQLEDLKDFYKKIILIEATEPTNQYYSKLKLLLSADEKLVYPKFHFGITGNKIFEGLPLGKAIMYNGVKQEAIVIKLFTEINTQLKTNRFNRFKTNLIEKFEQIGENITTIIEKKWYNPETANENEDENFEEQNQTTDGTVYFYSSDGTLLGRGYNTENISQVCLVPDEKLTEFKENFQNLKDGTYSTIYKKNVKEYYTKETYTQRLINVYAKDVGLSNEELNIRATLGMIKRAEAGPDESNVPLDYNDWNDGYKFTEFTFEQMPKDYAKHPGQHSITKRKYAGAYQFYEDFWKEVNFHPITQDNEAINKLIFRYALEGAKKGNIEKLKNKLQNDEWTSLQNWTISELQDVFNKQKINELNNNSKIAVPQGQLKF